MTYYLAENPWYLVGLLGLVGLGFLIATKVTADGRYVIRASIAFGLAATALLIEQIWVTDAERIEWVVGEIATAVGRSDGDQVLKQMDSQVTFSIRNRVQGDELDLSAIPEVLKNIDFDWVHVSKLTTNAGEQTRQGSAEFKVSVAGTYRMPGLGARAFTANTEWSLGFRKRPTGEWKVARITALSLPPYAVLPMFRFRSRRSGAAPSAGPSSGSSSQIGPPAPYRDRFGRRRPEGLLPGIELSR